MRITALVLCLAFLPVVAAQMVARTVKGERQQRIEYFDIAKTKPKLLSEFYEVKNYDAGDKLISTETVKDGYHVEWNEKGEEKRGVGGSNLPEGYFKLLEKYADGALKFREEFHPSGRPSAREYYDYFGKVGKRYEFYDAPAVTVDDPKMLEEWYQRGHLIYRKKLLQDGRLTLEERHERITDDDEYAITAKIEVEYYGDRRLKLKTSVEVTYAADRSGKVESKTTVIAKQTTRGVRTVTIDKVKREEGDTVLIDYEDAKDAKKDGWSFRDEAGTLIAEVKDGEWKYWDANGKLVKTETWRKGKLLVTEEIEDAD